MCVTRQDHVDTRDLTRHLLINVKPIVAKAHNQLSPLGAHLIHHLLHVFVADTERIFREHPTRICDWHVRECLTNDSNLNAATFEEFIGWEQLCRFVPFCIKYVLAKGGKRQVFNNLGHTIRAEREFPVERHRIRLQRVHNVDHVLPVSLIAGVTAVPCIATV